MWFGYQIFLFWVIVPKFENTPADCQNPGGSCLFVFWMPLRGSPWKGIHSSIPTGRGGRSSTVAAGLHPWCAAAPRLHWVPEGCLSLHFPAHDLASSQKDWHSSLLWFVCCNEQHLPVVTWIVTLLRITPLTPSFQLQNIIPCSEKPWNLIKIEACGFLPWLVLCI